MNYTLRRKMIWRITYLKLSKSKPWFGPSIVLVRKKLPVFKIHIKGLVFSLFQMCSDMKRRRKKVILQIDTQIFNHQNYSNNYIL